MEHGSAKWGDVFQIVKKYRDKKNPKENLILTQHFQMGMDGHKHKRNTNVLVIGGSGAGKSRSYAIPNALNCGNCSLVICDPKSEILRKTGGALKANGYEVRVFDLLNPDASFCYNPLAYVRDDKDVLRLIETLIQSTTRPEHRAPILSGRNPKPRFCRRWFCTSCMKPQKRNRTSPWSWKCWLLRGTGRR